MLLHRGILCRDILCGGAVLGIPISRLLHHAHIAQNVALTRYFVFLRDTHYLGVS